MKISNQIFILDLESLIWSKVPQENVLQPRESPVFVCSKSQKKVYILGGENLSQIFSLKKINSFSYKGYVQFEECRSDFKDRNVVWESESLDTVFFIFTFRFFIFTIIGYYNLVFKIFILFCK